jgi:hypothetical protein
MQALTLHGLTRKKSLNAAAAAQLDQIAKKLAKN